MGGDIVGLLDKNKNETTGVMGILLLLSVEYYIRTGYQVYSYTVILSHHIASATHEAALAAKVCIIVD